MAGSFKHVLNDAGNYRGVSLLENMRDMREAVEEMAFALLTIQRIAPGVVSGAIEEYYACLRGENPWPEFMKQPGI